MPFTSSTARAKPAAAACKEKKKTTPCAQTTAQPPHTMPSDEQGAQRNEKAQADGHMRPGTNLAEATVDRGTDNSLKGHSEGGGA
jgi:hypothetical protein